jgi:transposase
MNQVDLFGETSERDTKPTALPPRIGIKRLRHAVRNQVEFQQCAVDDLLPEDHEARIVWSYVCGLDLSELVAQVQAVEGGPGQAPPDPRILLALWLYATLRGVGSARELSRLCTAHIAYRWICGGVSMNHHTLSDFRVDHSQFLDKLFTQSVASLMAEGLVQLDRVAQDGMRVRASAGAASFRRQPTLEEALAEAEAQVAQLKQELESDPAASKTRQQAARQRAAEERAERIRAALEQWPQVAESKKPKDREKARVSTTDPEARVMKMGDGGFRPAYNVQLAAATDSQIITGVGVTNSGSDRGELAPMVEQHDERYDQTPDEMLVDGGFATKEDITVVSSPQGKTKVYAPVQKPRKKDVDPHEPRDGDTSAVGEWRTRMKTDEAKEIYKERASTIECVNALARNRGLQRFLVRGLEKVRAVTLLFALVHNLMRAVTLRAQAAQNLVSGVC